MVMVYGYGLWFMVMVYGFFSSGYKGLSARPRCFLGGWVEFGLYSGRGALPGPE